MNKYLKGFLCGCVNGLIFIVCILVFALGVYLVSQAYEYRTWDYITSLIVYVVVLFGFAGEVD